MQRVIALDVMGGDGAPDVVLDGAEQVLKSLHSHAVDFSVKNVHFLLFGDEAIISKALSRFPVLESHSTTIHAEHTITADLKPSKALRLASQSGMGMAIKAVHERKADAVVSAGNTGAYMALAKLIFKTIPGVDRPAIAKVMPTLRGRSVVLDLGANALCKVENLVQFGVMGAAFAYCSQTNPAFVPTVGLLNIGHEDSKGLPHLQEAATFLKDCVNFHGFIEGHDITAGTTDVVVTDGFTGNVALKSIEGTARLIKNFMNDALSSSLFGKLGYLVAKRSFQRLSQRMDPRMYNGAVFLGLQGIAVKSHGGTDGVGYREAIKVALDLVAPKGDISHSAGDAGHEYIGINRMIFERMRAVSQDNL